MTDTLRQIGELLLSSIPAIISLAIVWAAYRALVYAPLQKVLGERQARTEGAIRQAQEQVSAAEARTAEYERRVREARSRIYLAQEARSRHIMQQRDAALAEARRHAEATIKTARLALEKEVLAAKATLQQQADALAAQIIDIVLKSAAAVGGR
jgi:F-type H+-transporting ATPase subunit b